MFNLPCVILCGGKSSRMGEDKALLPFSTFKTLTEYQYKKLKPHFKEVYLSSKTEKFNFKNKLILDKEKEYSPIVALKSIFEFFKDENKLFIITVDTPLVEISTIEKLINESKDYDITLAKTSSREHNLCGVFSTKAIIEVEKMLEMDIHKVGYLLKKMDTTFIEFHNEDEFLNLNNKEEYYKAKSIIS
jgi:molybdopterin-guanine dinucleotide biosynthesis protein A